MTLLSVGAVVTFAPSQASDNRSLARGLEILRAFKPGLSALTNSEIAERTGLPRSTVSRLTGTLVRAGFLLHDAKLGGYRLSATVVGMSHVMLSGSLILKEALPLMQTVGRQMRVNVGLAVADHDDMIYLENLPFGPKASLRKVVVGQRVPVALTALGRAYLSTLDQKTLSHTLAILKRRHRRDWDKLYLQIISDMQTTQEQGYCAVAWQPGVVSIAAPLEIVNEPVHLLNMSLYTDDSLTRVAQVLSPALVRLRDAILLRLAKLAV
ncbi:IclR family transcriptional regulator [Orrella daihaiensis]|uniref:Helix-turn-helix domain-containing protein n=1 Tax=Orrella daihaiensis TaxID=2782176 RepID=A0ABY4ANV9_9BURK|nr:helix-turn-helix domain-containing protein [Orrella daihaiensis]UOD51311.1 helix-turn-helix domain-containing protein [Orrella daihaiensis]